MHTYHQTYSTPLRFTRLFSVLTAATLFGSIVTKAADKPIKVFILAGQSNMVGHGKAEEGRNPKFDPKAPEGKDNPKEIPGGLGSMRAMVNENLGKFGPKGTTPLVDADGKWLARKDVKIYAYCDEQTKKGDLTVGYAAPGATTWIGPEFGFGHAVGNALTEDVLIIKVSCGSTRAFRLLTSTITGITTATRTMR